MDTLGQRERFKGKKEISGAFGMMYSYIFLPIIFHNCIITTQMAVEKCREARWDVQGDTEGSRALENIRTGYICYLGPIYLALLFPLNFLHSLKVKNLLTLTQGVKRRISRALVHRCLFFLGYCTILTLFFNSYGQGLWGGIWFQVFWS